MHRSCATLALLALAACHGSYTAIGFDLQTHAAGTMQPVIAPTGSRGSVALGFRAGSVAMEIKANGEDLGLADHVVAGSAGLELKLRVLHHGPFAAYLHGGPMRAAVIDTDAMSVVWGAGYAYGAAVSVGYMGAHVFADLHDESSWYAATDAQPMAGGAGSVRAVTVGVILGL